VRDTSETLTARGVVAYGVNHARASSHEKFRRLNGYDFPLLVDVGGRVARSYEAGRKGKTGRHVYLIDPQGRIRFSEPGLPPLAEVLSVVG